MSSINKDATISWFEKLRHLNEKYIAEHCEYEVNLPYSLRSAMRNLIYLMKTQQQRMDDIFNKKDRKRNVATPSQDEYHTVTPVTTNMSTPTTVHSTATMATGPTAHSNKTSTQTRHTLTGTTSNVSSNAIVPANTTEIRMTFSELQTPPHTIPVTPYLAPTIPDIDENTPSYEVQNEEDDTGFDVLTSDHDEPEDIMIILDDYEEYKTPDANGDANTNKPRANTEDLNGKQHRMYAKGKLKLKRHSLDHLHVANDVKTLRLQRADTTPSSFASAPIVQKETKIEIEVDKLDLNAKDLPVPSMMTLSRSCDVAAGQSGRNTLKLRPTMSDNITHFTTRFSARFSGFGLFNSKNSNKSEADGVVNIDNENEAEDEIETTKPREVGLKDFVHVVNEIVLCLEGLNHQTLRRWRRTDEFNELRGTIDFGSLVSHNIKDNTRSSIAGRSTPSLK